MDASPKTRTRRITARGSAPRRARESTKKTRIGGENGPKRARGRPPGRKNYYSREFKEAMRMAAEQLGEDGKGYDGLATMATEVHVREQEKPETEEEVRSALASFGIRHEQLSGLRFYDREQKLIELMADDVTDNHSNGGNKGAGSS